MFFGETLGTFFRYIDKYIFIMNQNKSGTLNNYEKITTFLLGKQICFGGIYILSYKQT